VKITEDIDVKLLVVGGAGYIGSHFVKAAVLAGHRVVVADNLSTGHKYLVNRSATFYQTDIRDTDRMNEIFRNEDIDAVVHFAADSIVSESMKKPLEYYDNNVGGIISLLNSMKTNTVNKIVFSSTAAVYGEPASIPIEEDSATIPTNVYGETKLVIEKIMKRLSDNGDISYSALRYFNACGADESGEIGEDHNPETHLIPIVLQAAAGQREYISVFGSDYQTKDGTCIRDYIHVNDLASAHLKALRYLDNGGKSTSFNLGNGKGFSVLDIIKSTEKVTGRKIDIKISGRREGDPAQLIASYDKALKLLGWKPEYTDINKIIDSAWKWYKLKDIRND